MGGRAGSLTFAWEGEFAITVHLLSCFAAHFFPFSEAVDSMNQTPPLAVIKSLLSVGTWTLLWDVEWHWGHAAQALPWKAAWHAVRLLCLAAWCFMANQHVLEHRQHSLEWN